MRTNGKHPELKKPDPASSLDDGTEAATIMRVFYPLLIESAWADASLAGIPVAFDLANEHVQRVLSLLAKQIKGVAESTREDVRRLIGQQAEHGWSVEELAERIREMGEINSASRAVMIARSETAAAYSQGSLAAWRESGVVSGKEWLTGGDPCPICQKLDGARAALDADFGDGLSAPPAHPNCTCAVSPVLSEA